jgi:hypothetical protein
MKTLPSWWCRFSLQYAALFLMTCAGGLLAYETLGEVISALYLLATLLAQVPLLIIAQMSRRWAMIGAVGLALAVVPYQLYLGIRFLRVDAEAKRIVAYAWGVQQAAGSFPATLNNYSFTDPGTKRFIQAYEVLPRTGDFVLTYRVGTESTSHWYSSDTGWGYYPD